MLRDRLGGRNRLAFDGDAFAAAGCCLPNTWVVLRLMRVRVPLTVVLPLLAPVAAVVGNLFKLLERTTIAVQLQSLGNLCGGCVSLVHEHCCITDDATTYSLGSTGFTFHDFHDYTTVP